MKRVVKASQQDTQEKLADCLSEVADHVEHWLVMEGLTQREARQYFTITAKDTGLSPYCKIIEIRAEIAYEDFLNYLSQELNEIVTYYDSEAYFDCVDGSTWVCEIWLRDRPSDNPLENDPVFNEDGINYLEKCVRRRLDVETGQVFRVSRCEAWLKDYDNENNVYIGVSAFTENVETTAYVVVNRDEIDSRQQLKNEIAPALCKKLIENAKGR